MYIKLYNLHMAEVKAYSGVEASIGGDVADALGRLTEIGTEKHHQSLNPDGSPYAGLTADEVINTFASTHPEALPDLMNGLGGIFGIKSGQETDLPEPYTQARAAIQSLQEESSEQTE